MESGSEKEPLKEGKLILLVKTACELQAAVLGGAEHIEIGEHMDLTGLDLIDDHLLGPVPPTLKTIRVRFCLYCRIHCVGTQPFECDSVMLLTGGMFRYGCSSCYNPITQYLCLFHPVVRDDGEHVARLQ